MSEFSEGTEMVNEMVLESAKADEQGADHPHWHRQVAMSTLLMALITAVGALLAGITAHEALLDRTTEMIDVSIVENDRVSIEVLKAKVEILTELGQSPDPSDLALIQVNEAEIKVLEEEVALEESRVQEISATHLILAVAVTLLSLGITLSGMSIIVEQRILWLFGLVFGILGSIGVAYGVSTLVL